MKIFYFSTAKDNLPPASRRQETGLSSSWFKKISRSDGPVSLIFFFFIVTFFVLFVLLLTSRPLPLTWDEGESVARTTQVLAWFQSENPLTQQAIREHWLFTTQIEGHPAGYGVCIATGHTFCERFLPFLSQKTSYRFGPMFLFAMALGAVFIRIVTEKNISRPKAMAFFAVAAILLTPRLFAHAHIAACDSTLTACWLLAWTCFDMKKGNRWKVALWGIFLGGTFAAKFTGWIAIIPFFVATFFEKESAKKWFRFACGLAIAVLTFYVLNPPLWFEPIRGFVRFFELNTAREGFNISILFLGKMYNLDHPLPWYNTAVWVGVTIPLGFLFLIIYAIFVSGIQWFRKSSFPLLFSVLLHALSLLMIRAIPGTPPHDGTRLFITAFAFLAIAAGLGATMLCKYRFGIICVILIYATGMFNMYWYTPQWLSYYNAAIGGLPGAARAGMEPTYYWDALDQEVADWLEKYTPPDEIVLFSASSRKTLMLQKQWNEIQTDFYRKGDENQKGKRIRYYVLQRRPSGEYPPDRILIRYAKPVYVKTIRPNGIGPWRLSDVPILEIYEFQDYLKARRIFETKAGGSIP